MRRLYRVPVVGFMVDAALMSMGIGALVALFLAVVALFVGCASLGTVPPSTLRLESYESCVHAAGMFCQRSVSPSDLCLSDLEARYCR